MVFLNLSEIVILIYLQIGRIAEILYEKGAFALGEDVGN